jgi:hypothetical protein
MQEKLPSLVLTIYGMVSGQLNVRMLSLSNCPDAECELASRAGGTSVL